ncbi:MAG: nucleotide exchange factor GrpE [Candidatus Omnitrophota bacterium]
MGNNNKENKNGKNDKTNGQAQVPEAEEIILTKKEYEELKAKADERDSYFDKYVRAHAEFENARKRIEKDKIEYCKYANEGFLLEFLPILDNLEMAEKHIKEAKDFNAVREGVDMIQLQMQKFLKDIGVERIKVNGEKFDPHMHDPIEVVESDEKDDGKILAELKSGYRFNGRLLRPASVKIAKKKEEGNK